MSDYFDIKIKNIKSALAPFKAFIKRSAAGHILFEAVNKENPFETTFK